MQIERDQKKTLIIVSGLLLAFVMAVWLPSHFKMKKLNQQIIESQEQLGINDSGSSKLKHIYKQVEELRVMVSGVQQYVPKTDELPSLLDEIGRQIELQQVTNQNIEYPPIERGADYSVIPVSLKFKGNFQSVYRFLVQIETMHRLIRINELSIDGDAEEQGAPMAVRVELTSFSAPMKENKS